MVALPVGRLCGCFGLFPIPIPIPASDHGLRLPIAEAVVGCRVPVNSEQCLFLQTTPSTLQYFKVKVSLASLGGCADLDFEILPGGWVIRKSPGGFSLVRGRSLNWRKRMLKKLRTYNLAVDFHKAGRRVGVPGYLRNQWLRASSSIVLNTAEGYGKSSPKDRARFYSIALGSLREPSRMSGNIGSQ